MTSEPAHDNSAHCDNTALEHCLVEGSDISSVVSIYIDQFPDRVGRFFRRPEQAHRFYTDLFTILHATNKQTFFGVRSHGRLIAFLLLTRPDASAAKALLHSRLGCHVGWSLLTGRYGLSRAFLTTSVNQIIGRYSAAAARVIAKAPMIYSVAIRRDHTGKGIGTALILRAKDACSAQYSTICLYVDQKNHGGIRLYDRLGFYTVEETATEKFMAWEITR